MLRCSTPRLMLCVQGCSIEPEDQEGHQQWRWRVVEPGGNLLLRLGTGRLLFRLLQHLPLLYVL